jgi:hypothetical protein
VGEVLSVSRKEPTYGPGQAVKFRHEYYTRAVQWIALNDDPSCLDLKDISRQISVVLIADLFSVDPEKVAGWVLSHRETPQETWEKC